MITLALRLYLIAHRSKCMVDELRLCHRCDRKVVFYLPSLIADVVGIILAIKAL